MKIFSTAAMAEIRKGSAIVVGAAEIECDPPVRVWGGYWPITIDGKTFQPIGDRGIAQVSGASIGGAEQGISLTLSGIEPEALELLDAEEVKDAPVTLWRLIFKGDGKTMLDAQVFDRGRLDQLPTSETIGGEASITAMVESAARGLGRSGGRMRSDADQRLIEPTDGFFRNVSFAAEKQLAWGGKPSAAAGSVLPGSGGGSGGGGGGGGGFQNQAYDEL